ncbi:MAG: Serine/threonine protein kinase PrkC, regulator of stationary phase [Myxococcales bacterium]|nr:Serine/threonine protein kinase PrkC, regulator of stationary phase [Myxococcales bacterium]
MTEAAPDTGELVWQYRVIRAIGAGGSARIDLARIDRAYGFQRHVVVKRPLEHLRRDFKVSASLQLEARIGGRLRHPNLVSMLDAGTHDGYDYVVLEYVHGAALRSLMDTETGGQVRALPSEVAIGIAIDVARGLHEAHELADDHGRPLGLVHRDVSPGNVLLGLDGAVKVADFGIAKETRVTTLSGSMHGTVTYMAPEQCRGHAFDRRADIFSIGVILYELATRTRLFWADNDVASLHRVLSGKIERPRKVNPQLSSQFEEIVMTAVAQDPEHRFATACELADALEALAAAEGHIVGARWVARAVEETIGAKRAPWIASTTTVDGVRFPSEGSLVDAIEALPVELESEPVWPTFGPSDERSLEEGVLPSAPLANPPVRPVRRGWRAIAIAVVGAAIAAGVVVGSRSGDGSAPAPSPTRTSAPAPAPSLRPDPASVSGPDPVRMLPPPAAPVSDPTPAPEPARTSDSRSVPDPSATPAVPAAATPAAAAQPARPVPAPAPAPATITRTHRHHASPPTAPIAAGSDATAVAQPPPPAEPAGSGVKPPPSRVEWKPTMLLPSDTGSSKRTP